MLLFRGELLRFLLPVALPLTWLLTGCKMEAAAPQLVASVPTESLPSPTIDEADAAHTDLYTKDSYPSATQCRTCHPGHYREWSASPHAYAQISPVFNAMQGEILKRSNGTLGDFCIRCHTPVGMALGEPLFVENAQRDPISLEGVTCIVCHRVNKKFGKNNGRTELVRGDIFDKVFGPRKDDEVQRVIESPGEFGKVVTEQGDTGRRIHNGATFFEPISSPGFCGTCHDVTLIGGLRFEEAFSEYKHSPAAARGETCQDCHMGIEPGVVSGYRMEPAAVVAGVPTKPRKRSGHGWPGPDYSIVHPGIFPQNPEASEMASIADWTTFDWREGWGSESFEDVDHDDIDFPDRWGSVDDRIEAREIIDQQLLLLDEAFAAGTKLLERGYELGSIDVKEASSASGGGLRFSVPVRNGIDGHNVPTGFIAERLVFLQVTVTDPSGMVIFRSGDLDPNGDVRDSHSLYVHAGKLPSDDQLFNLQSKFVIQNVYGGESEQVLAVNFLVDPLPYIRPDPVASVLLGRPTTARIHRFSIEPNGTRDAGYSVPRKDLDGPGDYQINIKLIAAMVPSNLINEIQGVGFDYGMSPREVADAILEGHRVLHEADLTVTVK